MNFFQPTKKAIGTVVFENQSKILIERNRNCRTECAVKYRHFVLGMLFIGYLIIYI